MAQVFPEPYCSAFKVYDYGFTPISQYTKGGYAEDFELMKLQCSGVDREQPYLLFAREVNEAGIVSKIWVDVKLPREGKFSCLTATQRSLVKIRVEKAVADAMAKGGGKDFPLVTSGEASGMDKLREEVVDIIICCEGRNFCTSCLKKDAVVDFFDNIGAYTQDVIITAATPKNEINTNFAEYAEVKISDKGQDISLNEILQQMITDIKSTNRTVKVFLTADVNFCFKTSSTSAKGMNPPEDLTMIDKVKLDFEAATEDYVLWINASLENKVLFKKVLRREETFNNTPECSCNRAYSGTATAQDRIYALQEIKDFANNPDRKGVWDKIDKDIFCDQLYNTIENFKNAYYLDQGDTYLCGPAGTLRIFCEYAPIDFVKFAINLFEKGEDKSHNGCVGKIIKANSTTKSKNPSNGLSSLAYVLMTSIRSSYNNILGYDPENETVLSGFGVPGESTKLLSNFGCIKNNTLKHIPSPHEGGFAKEVDPAEMRQKNKEQFMDNYLQMKKELDKDYIWFALINSCYFGKLTKCNLVEEFGGDLTNGNHYIVITKMDLITPDILSLDIWTWGQEKKGFQISIWDFMRATNWIWSYK